MGTATTLTLMVGVLLIVFRLIRLGWMLEAVSEATLAGLKVGVGLTIIADQLPKLLGIPSTEGDFFGDVWNAIEQLPEANLATALIGGITIAFLLVLRAWKPKVPGPLLALAFGIGLVVFTGVTDRGVATIPEVPTGLPACRRSLPSNIWRHCSHSPWQLPSCPISRPSPQGASPDSPTTRPSTTTRSTSQREWRPSSAPSSKPFLPPAGSPRPRSIPTPARGPSSANW